MARDPKGRTDGLKWGEGTISQRPSGSWQARWSEAGANGIPVRRSKSFPSQDLAEDHLRHVHRAVRDGRYVPPSERTVADLVNDWLERGRHHWKPSTYISYAQRAKSHVLPHLGSIRAETITTPRVQHWIDQLVRSGFDPGTVDSAHRVLSGALREAVRLGALPVNPATGIRKPPLVMKESPTWTSADVAAVTRTLRDEPMWSALYRVALSTGMRPGELRALQWRDLDLAAGLITVRRTITKDAQGLVVMGATTKTGRSRVIAISSACVRALSSWRTAQIARRLACSNWQADDIVFDRGDGRFLPLTTWQRRHTQLIEDAGVTTITLHQLRHSHATLELAAGTHPKLVSDRLGHRSIQTTLDRYSHVTPDLAKAAAEALDARLFGDDDATTKAV